MIEARKTAPLRAAKRKPSTRAALARLKQVLQNRLAELEKELTDIGIEAAKAGSERDIRSTHMLVRTLEKVLELERKERTSKARRIKQLKRIDDEARLELVRRIEALPTEGSGEKLHRPTNERGSGSADP